MIWSGCRAQLRAHCLYKDLGNPAKADEEATGPDTERGKTN